MLLYIARRVESVEHDVGYGGGVWTGCFAGKILGGSARKLCHGTYGLLHHEPLQELVAIGKAVSLDGGFPNAVIEVVLIVLLSVSVVRYVRGEQHTIVELQELAPHPTLYRYGAL